MFLPFRWNAVILALALAATAPASAFDVTRGGQAGAVLRVTTLADDGPGSLRAAIEATGPRRIVFDVAGEIWPRGTILIRNPYLTIDGETAPSPGISIMGQKIRVRSHDVIIRHLRIRIGARADGTDPDNRDGLSIDGAENGKEPSYNVLVENCSIAWAIDENVQLWGVGNHSIVLRDNIIAEGLMRSIHPKGVHSMGLIVGPGVRDVLIQGNLFAHNAARNPVVDSGASAVVLNNVIYGPQFNGFHIYGKPGRGPTLASVVGNIAIAAPKARPYLYSFRHGANPGTQIYFKDNVSQGFVAFDRAEGTGRDGSGAPPIVETPPIWFEGLKVLPTREVEQQVLARAGARPKERDAADRRIVEQVRTRSGGLVDEPSDPRLRAGATER